MTFLVDCSDLVDLKFFPPTILYRNISFGYFLGNLTQILFDFTLKYYHESPLLSFSLHSPLKSRPSAAVQQLVETFLSVSVSCEGQGRSFPVLCL